MSRRALSLCVLILAVAPVQRTHAQSGQFDLEKTKTVLSGLIERAIKERGVPSMSIALVRGDSVVWKSAFGYANVRTKTPATTATLYSTGSTFKSVTATALLQLQEQGKFKIDEPINRYLGDDKVQDQQEKPVTFRHMLSHWSGLNSSAETKPLWGRELPKTLPQLTRALHSVRAPEVKWEYNNFMYGTAGLLVEKLSGEEYEKYMLEHILQPLGVTTAHPVYPSPEMVELMALPYMPGGATGKPTPVAQVHYDVYPAGDIYLTAEDMAHFLAMHLNGGVYHGKRILSEASIKAAHEPQYTGTYAFGWDVKKDLASGHTIISHSGGIPGMSSMMMGDVDAKVGVYFMSNSGGPPAIAAAALKLLRGEAYVEKPAPKEITLEPTVLDRYVGDYEVNADFAMHVRRDGTHLMVQQGNDAAKTQLLASAPGTFFVKGQDWTITFGTNASGAVEKMVLDTGSDRMEMKRKK